MVLSGISSDGTAANDKPRVVPLIAPPAADRSRGRARWRTGQSTGVLPARPSSLSRLVGSEGGSSGDPRRGGTTDAVAVGGSADCAQRVWRWMRRL
eukprot:6927-Chlamydomonas_euryale.AAC.4